VPRQGAPAMSELSLWGGAGLTDEVSRVPLQANGQARVPKLPKAEYRFVRPGHRVGSVTVGGRVIWGLMRFRAPRLVAPPRLEVPSPAAAAAAGSAPSVPRHSPAPASPAVSSRTPTPPGPAPAACQTCQTQHVRACTGETEAGVGGARTTSEEDGGLSCVPSWGQEGVWMPWGEGQGYRNPSKTRDTK
jgi:hypothetical protein